MTAKPKPSAATKGALTRTLHLTTPPMHGPDVVALQRALKAAGIYRGRLDGEYSAATAHACEIAKTRLGYPKALIHHDHEYAGATLLAYLAGKKRLPKAYTLLRRQRLGLLTKPTTKTPPVTTSTKAEAAASAARAAIVAYWRWAIANADRIGYAETRPMRQMDALKQLPQTNDCSTEVTKSVKFAGLPDPNGLAYNGLGYTGTLLNHCRHIAQAQAKAGDLAVLGPYPGHHVVVLLEDGIANGRNPLCGSHGKQADPRAVRLKNEAAYQPAPVTFLEVIA